jgi:putative ABC transport system permease protein
MQFYTYLLLKEGMSPQAVAAKFPALLRRNLDENAASAFTPFLQPLTDIHLRSHLFREMQPNSDIGHVYIFTAVAFFILLIACINFMNLTTARAATRAKEVAVRKVSGADQGQLIKQFLGESVLISLGAMILALFLVVLLLPVFNSLIGRQLTQNFRGDKAYLLILLGITLGVGLVSGSYPAFVLSALKPVNVLKKKWAGTRGAWLRQGLVVFQFGISAFLMIATGIVYSQLKHIQNIKLGFNKEQLVIIPIRDEAVRMKYETLKRELLQDPNVVSVAASGNLPGGSDWGIPYEAEGLPPEKTPPMRVLAVDHDFVATFEMELAAGRSFSRDHSNDAKTYMVNEEAAKQLGWKDPVGKTIAMPAIQREKAPVIGVLKDFHFRSLHEKIGPIMFFIPPPDWFTVFSVRIRSENVSKTLAVLERIWAKFDPSHPFNYSFFDEQFDRLHQSEKQIGRLLGYVALLAVIIACLGLFGLAAFTAEQRTKEIGIRKVLGASAGGIIFLLSKDFAKLALIGFIIAAPLAYYAMSRWLGDFAYRTNIGPGVFVLSGLLALVTTWLTVSYQSIKAALANPVDSLHYE